MVQKFTDAALIQKILAGDTASYAILVKNHQRFVFTLALRFTKNRQEAEEIAQDCFVKAYRALGTYQQNAKFSTWLYSITYTTAMTFLRKKRLNLSSIHDEGTAIQLSDRVSANNADAYDLLDRKRHINEAINRLHADDAAIITLFYQGEQSLEEIGLTMAISPNNVKVRLYRARLKLKALLQYELKNEVKDLI